MRKKTVTQIKRKRVIVGLIGFLMGYGIGLLVDSLINPDPLWRVALASGIAGMFIALHVGEKMAKIPTADELVSIQFEEGMHPLGLSLKEPDQNGPQAMHQ